jgi:hypothetical protein
MHAIPMTLTKISSVKPADLPLFLSAAGHREDLGRQST